MTNHDAWKLDSQPELTEDQLIDIADLNGVDVEAIEPWMIWNYEADLRESLADY